MSHDISKLLTSEKLWAAWRKLKAWPVGCVKAVVQGALRSSATAVAVSGAAHSRACRRESFLCPGVLIIQTLAALLSPDTAADKPLLPEVLVWLVMLVGLLVLVALFVGC